jgi:RNA polymerase sigma-70 factor, ECF subfamily
VQLSLRPLFAAGKSHDATPRPSPSFASAHKVSEQDTDLALVARVQAGERGAFDLLVRKYQHKVISVIGRMVYDFAEAQDVAQETFLRAYRAIGNFRGDSAFYTWLHTIATNTARNHLSASGRRPPTDDVQVEDAEHFEDALRMKDNATPEREMLRQEMERAVSAAVADLPSELREAITLREVDGLSYEEIAQKMSSPIGTVRSRIFRARDAIDQRLRPLVEGRARKQGAV